MATRIKFTAKVKRGLALMRQLIIDSYDHDASWPDSIVDKWRKPQVAEFNAAMEWVAQVDAAREAKATAALADAPKEVADMLAAAIGGAE